ncbi:MAG: cation transporter, partial [Pseudomonadota bacterium]
SIGLALIGLMHLLSYRVRQRARSWDRSRFQFGHGKLEQLVNAGFGMALLAVGIVLLWTALGRNAEPYHSTNAWLFGFAALVLMVCMLLLSRHDLLYSQVDPMAELPRLVYRVQRRSALIVQGLLTTAALAEHPVHAYWLDAGGSIAIALAMVGLGWRILSRVLPDIVDAGLPLEQKLFIRAIIHEVVAPEDTVAVRCRSSAHLLFVELVVDSGNYSNIDDLLLQRRQISRKLAQHRLRVDLNVIPVTPEQIVI